MPTKPDIFWPVPVQSIKGKRKAAGKKEEVDQNFGAILRGERS